MATARKIRALREAHRVAESQRRDSLEALQTRRAYKRAKRAYRARKRAQ